MEQYSWRRPTTSTAVLVVWISWCAFAWYTQPASQQVFIEWPWRQQQLSVQSGGGEYRESLAVGGVVPNTSLLRRLAPTRGLELMMSCGVTGFRFFLALPWLKLEGLLKYLWLDSIGIGWQKRGEQSKIKSEECDRDYSESDSNSKKEEPSL